MEKKNDNGDTDSIWNFRFSLNSNIFLIIRKANLVIFTILHMEMSSEMICPTQNLRAGHSQNKAKLKSLNKTLPHLPNKFPSFANQSTTLRLHRGTLPQ